MKSRRSKIAIYGVKSEVPVVYRIETTSSISWKEKLLF